MTIRRGYSYYRIEWDGLPAEIVKSRSRRRVRNEAYAEESPKHPVLSITLVNTKAVGEYLRLHGLTNNYLRWIQ